MVKIEDVQMNELETGDQIAVMGDVAALDPALASFMSHSNGKYFHHGIFDKEKMEVIDFYGETKYDTKPNRRPFLHFFKGHHNLYRVVHRNPLPVPKTMEMAEEAVRQQRSWRAYHLIKYNCETFATYLKTNIECSSQVFDAAKHLTERLLASPSGKAIAAGSMIVASAVAGPVETGSLLGSSLNEVANQSMDVAAGIVAGSFSGILGNKSAGVDEPKDKTK